MAQSTPWIHKYTPSSTSEVVGQQSAIHRLKAAVSSWSRTSKPLFLWGESGAGKTCAALALAKENDYELIEINASDSRNKAVIESLVGGAINQGSLFGTQKLILIDEVDGLSGTADRGGIPALVKALKNSSFPIIITGLDPFGQKVKELRKVCELLEFSALSSNDLAALLQRILARENVSYDEESVLRIARSSGGDARAAINDAQSASTNGKLVVDDSLLGQREQTESIENALLRVFKTTQASVAKGAFDLVSEDVDKIMLWVDYNMPFEYTKTLDLSRGYEVLSQADLFLGRIRRWQYYRYYVYVYDLLTAGIALAKDEKYKGVSTYKQSTRLLSIWMANQKNAKKKVVAEKIAAKTHTSRKRAYAEVPFIQYMYVKNASLRSSFEEYFGLEKEETQWLVK